MNRITDSLIRAWQSSSTPFLEISGASLSLSSLLLVVLLLVLSYYASKMTTRTIGKVLDNKPIDRGLKGAIERLSGYIVFLFGILLALDLIGISLKSIAAFSALLIIGLGFAFQSIIQNFIAGIILLIERPVKKGDMIQMNGTYGRVLDIGFRSTAVQTRDDVVIVVPNSELVTLQVVNESFNGDQIRLHVLVRTHLNESAQNIRKLLLEIAVNHPNVLKNPPPTILLNQFAEYGLEFKVIVWTEELWLREVLLSDLRYQIHAKFQEHGIVIPVPQREIKITEGQL